MERRRGGEEGSLGGEGEEERRMLMDSISPPISHLSFVILYLNLCFQNQPFPLFAQAFDEVIKGLQINAPSFGRCNNTFPPPAQ